MSTEQLLKLNQAIIDLDNAAKPTGPMAEVWGEHSETFTEARNVMRRELAERGL